MATTKNEEELIDEARFVFKGSVQKLNASNVAEVEAVDKSKTVIVRVDEIIQAPEAFADQIGRDVTVKLRSGGGKKLKAGESAVFYTNGWIMAENLGVEEVAHRPIEAATRAMSAASADPARNLAERDVQKRLSSADVVITGKVSSIRIPEDAQTRGMLSESADGTTQHKPVSEHDPEWREAVVEVADVEKGPHAKKNIVIRFPSSEDVRWYKAPKFVPGQEGIFILHKTQEEPATGKRAMGTVTSEEAETTEAFTALHPADFQPLKKLTQVKTLMEAAPETDND